MAGHHRSIRLLGQWWVVLAMGSAVLAGGCVRVQPWERDLLSKRTMNFASERDEQTLDHTFYNAREGAAGGFESGGGGCGCN